MGLKREVTQEEVENLESIKSALNLKITLMRRARDGSVYEEPAPVITSKPENYGEWA